MVECVFDPKRFLPSQLRLCWDVLVSDGVRVETAPNELEPVRPLIGLVGWVIRARSVGIDEATITMLFSVVAHIVRRAKLTR